MTDTPAPASPAATEMAAIDALAEASSPVTWAAENLSLEDRDWLRGQLRSIARTEFGRLADLGFTMIPTLDLAALRAERDRLRDGLKIAADALEEIAERTWDKRHPDATRQACDDASAMAGEACDAARAALAEGRADG